ncbi:MAG: restriction endonuclease subunit R, partial [Candidatus Thorarchaeota archaeon]
LISRFVVDQDLFKRLIKKILLDQTHLFNKNQKNVFSNKFLYLKELINQDSNNLDHMYQNILEKVFYKTNPDSNILKLTEIVNHEGEIGLSFGSQYFGLINIGDTSKFLNIIREDDKNNIRITPKSFSTKSFFDDLNTKESTINLLLGSKKFQEGWDSYRVSTMILLNIGKSEGTQIIQLFGRGIRLKGYQNSLKRSTFLLNEKTDYFPSEIPKYIVILEQLSIFGLNANYMEKFREVLELEGVNTDQANFISINQAERTKSYPKPRSSNKRLEFVNKVPIYLFEVVIENFKYDCRPKIEEMASITRYNQKESGNQNINEIKIKDSILELLDYQQLYLGLLTRKQNKGYYNLYFTLQDIYRFVRKKNYAILGDGDLFEVNTDTNIEILNQIQTSFENLLSSFMDYVFKYQMDSWLEKETKETIFIENH